MKGQTRDYTLTAKDAKEFGSLQHFPIESGLETHGVEVDFGIFINLPAPDGTKPHGVYHASDLDFRLKPKGKAVDKGVILPNINNNFKVKHPIWAL